MPTEPRLLHVTYAHHDEDWVQGVLVPALGLTDDQVWMRGEADPGSLKLEELQRAVKAHRYTLLVVSSAARMDQWAQFAAHLAEYLEVEEGKPRLLLAALDFEPGSERARELVPLSQRCLDCFDFSTPERTTAALAKLAGQLAVATTPEPPTECPYPGLRMFGTDDPGSFHRIDLFFGRNEEGRAIVEKLCRGGRVLLVGPSGCGKSSLVRARVLPALVQGAGAIAHVIARPDAHPDTALRAALDALDPRLGPATDAYLGAKDAKAAEATLVAATAGPGRLLYLDQFEEVFHDDAGEGGEHARFFARLAALGRVPGLALLLNMRADFYGDLMHSPVWDDFKDHRVELAPMRGAALRQAIARPAEAVGVYVEPDLVERLIQETDQDRSDQALPLLQMTLVKLWEQREWRYLSMESYQRIPR